MEKKFIFSLKFICIIYFLTSFSLGHSQNPLELNYFCSSVEIAILRADASSEAEDVKVAQWQTAFGSGTDPQFDNLFCQTDQDRIYIRIIDADKTGDGAISVHMETFGVAGSSLVDMIDMISDLELTENPSNSGIFISDPILLVSNQVDDDYDEGIFATDHTINIFSEDLINNHENVRTGGFLRVEYDFATGSGPATGSEPGIVQFDKDICHNNTIKVRLFSLRNQIGGTPFVSLERMRQEVAKMNISWAQACVRVIIDADAAPVIVDPPSAELFIDEGVFDPEFGFIVGEMDGEFTFLDRGDPMNNNEGMFDGIHGAGEAHETFTDNNNNDFYDWEVDLSDGLLRDEIAISREERNLIDTYSDGDLSTIEFFGIGFYDDRDRFGELFTGPFGLPLGAIRGKSYQANGPMGPYLKVPNQIIVSEAQIGIGEDPFTGAHELGHVILQDADHIPSFSSALGKINLMKDFGTDSSDDLDHSKRLNNTQTATAITF